MLIKSNSLAKHKSDSFIWTDSFWPNSKIATTTKKNTTEILLMSWIKDSWRQFVEISIVSIGLSLVFTLNNYANWDKFPRHYHSRAKKKHHPLWLTVQLTTFRSIQLWMDFFFSSENSVIRSLMRTCVIQWIFLIVICTAATSPKIKIRIYTNQQITVPKSSTSFFSFLFFVHFTRSVVSFFCVCAIITINCEPNAFIMTNYRREKKTHWRFFR